MVTVYKSVTKLTFDGFIRDLYTTFGKSNEEIRLMWQAQLSKGQGSADLPDSRTVHLGQGVHREQLHPGDELEETTTKYLDQIQGRDPQRFHRATGRKRKGGLIVRLVCSGATECRVTGVVWKCPP